MNKKQSKIKSTIITILVLLIIAGGLIAAYLLIQQSRETKFYDNPAVNGNTAGNLYNDGLYAEADGKVYFSNPLDKGCLYVMNEDETKAEKVSEETVYSLNVCGDYIYYCKNNLNDSNSTTILRGSVLGAARCNLNGGAIVDLNDRYTGCITLIGNNVLIQDYESDTEEKATTCTIKSISIDGREEKIITEKPIDIAGVAGSLIYYTGVENDHNIYSLNPKTKATSTIVEGNCWMPYLYQNSGKKELYYIDLEDNYSLVRTSLSNPEEKEVLVKERISAYNVSDTYIYFQIDDQDNSKLCRIRRDASTNEYEVIKEGNFENINITSKYVYFNQFDNETATYRTPVDGTLDVQLLSEAVEFAP